ncbi:hypothetical protein [Ralstonia mannitolilytica]|uniref:hypothetical protein n=1 Tax=Ralstonia mannitolilytica TaxID=105219 RepID=UPI00289BE12E|nr:hypothetical protein [Ralstonia mannitolilytica]
MSGTRSEIERFFRTLLLGDFEEEQSTSAQLVGGLISMVPVLDQVMDARDITGTLFQINKRGGSSTQIALSLSISDSLRSAPSRKLAALSKRFSSHFGKSGEPPRVQYILALKLLKASLA